MEGRDWGLLACLAGWLLVMLIGFLAGNRRPRRVTMGTPEVEVKVMSSSELPLTLATKIAAAMLAQALQRHAAACHNPHCPERADMLAIGATREDLNQLPKRLFAYDLNCQSSSPSTVHRPPSTPAGGGA